MKNNLPSYVSMCLCGSRLWIKIFTLSVILVSCNNTHLLKEIKKLDHYPSASGIEYFNKQFFVIGDDANDLLVLDSNFNIADSISIYSFPKKRIPKTIKPDLESILLTRDGKLLLLGSGSLSPYRNVCWLIDPITKEKDSTPLDTFYQRLKYNGITEINIEGATSIPGSIILSNRGHKAYRRNYLVFTNSHFWNNQQEAPIDLILIGSNPDTAEFNGISGISYAPKSDRLIMTVSTENTSSAYDDGTIGKSYLWIVNSISSKKRWKSINPNQVIDLNAVDARFKGQKIESVCVVKETKHFLHLVLAADNDDGSSTLFKVLVEKN
ncbi:MAG TPA: hypothetical protein VF487_15960 [Chitinophagaceae bacterium]